jgi:hypothetical protein
MAQFDAATLFRAAPLPGAAGAGGHGQKGFA